MKFYQLILIAILAAMFSAMVAGCKDAPLPPADTRHKGISAEDQKLKKGD